MFSNSYSGLYLISFPFLCDIMLLVFQLFRKPIFTLTPWGNGWRHVLAKTSVNQLTTSPRHQARIEILRLLTLLLVLRVPETLQYIKIPFFFPRTDSLFT